MSVAPPSNPAILARETRRARLAVLAVTVGIAATLLAYGLAPGVRHAVSHAAHTVKHAVSHVFDPDATSARRHGNPPKRTSAPTGASTTEKSAAKAASP
jgi:hypothetical protein